MYVTFTKLAGRRYRMTVVREHGPELAPRHGPGYDDHLPHDAVHFLVEAQARLAWGVFGQIATGRSNLFWPADPAQVRRQARREKKRVSRPDERADMSRCEILASLCKPLWELRAGHRSTLPAWTSRVQPGLLDSPLVQGIVARLDEFAGEWFALPRDGGITLAWPLPVRRPAGLQRASRPPRLVETAETSHRTRARVGA